MNGSQIVRQYEAEIVDKERKRGDHWARGNESTIIDGAYVA